MRSPSILDPSEVSEAKIQATAAKPLRHCMVVQNYYPFSEVRVQREAEALMAQGHVVDVICRRFGSEPLYESNGQLSIHRIGLGQKKWSRFAQLFEYVAFAFLAFLKVSRLHLKNRFNVVQCHNLPDFLVFAALVPRLTGSRVILDIHDLMPEFYCSRFKQSMDSLPAYVLKLQEYLSCRFAHRVITVTDLWRDTLIKRGVPKEKCFVVMNLADETHFTRQPLSRRLQKNGGEGLPLRLLYHGTLAHRYGIDLLLRAYQSVRNEIPNISLRIHGRGDYIDAIRELVKELGLQKDVEVTTEFLTSVELAELIQSHDVGIVPYRRDVFTDGILPTKLLEYVALGVPAVVARTSVVSHYFSEDTVEFFNAEDVEDLADRIRKLYRDKARREQLARNSEKFNSVYNWPRQRDAYVRFVERVACK